MVTLLFAAMAGDVTALHRHYLQVVIMIMIMMMVIMMMVIMIMMMVKTMVMTMLIKRDVTDLHLGIISRW